MRDFLFIDQRRLASYIEQIGSPITFDKVPVLSTSLSLTGPKVSVIQDRNARLYTDPEKIKILIRYLKSINQISTRRPICYDSLQYDPIFHIESCKAIKILVPPNKSINPPFQGISLWYSKQLPPTLNVRSDGELRPLASSLLLLEDYSRFDNTSPIFVSGYSALNLFTDFVFSERKMNEVGIKLATSSRNAFRQNPIAVLGQLGAISIREYDVTIFYRVINGTVEKENELKDAKDLEFVTLGYILVIGEGESDLDA